MCVYSLLHLYSTTVTEQGPPALALAPKFRGVISAASSALEAAGGPKRRSRSDIATPPPDRHGHPRADGLAHNPLTVPEFIAFLGMRILMGRYFLSLLSMLWSGDDGDYASSRWRRPCVRPATTRSCHTSPS